MVGSLRLARPAQSRRIHLQHAAADLVFLDRFEQRLEVAFAKTVVALALDELEEDRPDRIGREYLQQYLGVAAVDHAFAVDQDAVLLQPRDVLAVFRQPRIDLREIGVGRRRHERQARRAQAFDGAMDILAAAGDVLDAFAAIDLQIFLDLAGIAGILVDRNPDLAVGTGQRARQQARRPALDVEEANLAEVEQLFVEAGPDVHAAAMNVMGEVVEIEQSRADRPRIALAEPIELGIIGRTLGAIAIDEIQQAAADALDGGYVERLLRRG